MVTRLPAFTEGVTSRLTPVSLYCRLLVMSLPSLFMVCPASNGCWVPTLMAAVWLSSTIKVGLATTFKSVLLDRALSTARTLPAELRTV